LIPKPGPGQRWRFAANLDWLYPEHPYLDRFHAARQDGFEAVELLRPYAFAVDDLQARLQGLRVALINAPAGDWDAGERGLAALPGREAEFRAATAQGWQLALQLGSPLLHVMSGIAEDTPETRSTWLANLRWRPSTHRPASPSPSSPSTASACPATSCTGKRRRMSCWICWARSESSCNWTSTTAGSPRVSR
jgi:hypothetical protein